LVIFFSSEVLKYTLLNVYKLALNNYNDQTLKDVCHSLLMI
jgi:hypothetical protein